MYRRGVRPRSALLASLSLPLFLALALAGCDGGTDPETTAGNTGGNGGSGAAAGGETTGGGGAGGGQGGAGATGGGGGAVAHTTPDAKFIPTAVGACPEFADGMVTVSPDAGPRDVRVWISEAAASQDGPLVFFWHGVGGSPTDATYALGNTVINEITAMGGMVVAPVHDPAAGQFPWYLTLGGTNETDLLVMDEVLACAIQKVGVDMRRIHSVGFSAGAMNTTQVGWRRSGYIASVVTFSGAQLGNEPPDQDPTNLFPAMVVHGGPEDIVVIKFMDNSIKYHEYLKSLGHFSFLCNHNKKHTVPTDIRVPAWQFLQDHPFGQQPEPYAGGLPGSFPAYCSL